MLFLHAVFGQELVNASRAVEHLLLAGIERMTVAADFRGQLLAACGFGLVDMSAGPAGNSGVVVVGMDAGFHKFLFRCRGITQRRANKRGLRILGSS